MTPCISFASYPGLRHDVAAAMALVNPPTEPIFGTLSTEHVQLVPQSFGQLTEERATALREAWPKTQFRLHANVRCLKKHLFADLSNFGENAEYFTEAARISKVLGAPAYTAHSGYRAQADMATMLDNARRCADLFGCPVGIEGQYPNKEANLLVNSWAEYRQVFDSGLPYALDLSHLNILAHKTKRQEMQLVKEMLASDQLLECHVSANNGTGDWHQVCDDKPWWYELLPHINPNAVTFSEGNHRRSRDQQVAAAKTAH